MSRSTETKNPNGGAIGRRGVLQPSLGADLLEQILMSANIRRAFSRVKANKGAAGVDGMTVDVFTDWARQNWTKTRSTLMEGTYRPQPVLRVEIPKAPGAGKRKLGIPTVLDRVICQAIAQVLSERLDPEFSESSFGYRPGRSAHGALRQIQTSVRRGYRIAVDIDVEGFFDNVNHDVIFARLSRHIRDKRVLRLVGLYLRAGVVVDGQIHPTPMGIAQGSPLSPLLANLVLDDLDKELEQRGHRFARYADDVLIVVKSKSAGNRVMASISRFLKARLKLSINVDKSRVAPIDQTSFLGFTFRRGKICWSEKTLLRFKQEVKRFTDRNWGVSMARRLREFGRYLRGWMNYFGLSGYYRPIPVLESWIRRRIRACYWVMWKRRYTRIGKLIALGIFKPKAVWIGRASKGPWRMANNH